MKRWAYLFLIIMLLSNFFGASLSFSKTFTGLIEKSNSSFFIIKNNSKFELLLPDVSMVKVIQKLTNQDYISIDGTLLPPPENIKKTRLLKVNSINYIGLNELVGFWKDKNGLCYYFIGFTNIKVFIPGPLLKCNSKSIPLINRTKLTSYNYFINPDEDVWTMLISNETTQYLAELTSISSTKKKLVMYNAEDGQKRSEVILFKNNP